MPRSRSESPGGRQGAGEAQPESANFYERLGISRGAKKPQITAAFHKLSKLYHPEARGGGNAEWFKKIAEAYDALKDDEKREIYDESLETDEDYMSLLNRERRRGRRPRAKDPFEEQEESAPRRERASARQERPERTMNERLADLQRAANSLRQELWDELSGKGLTREQVREITTDAMGLWAKLDTTVRDHSWEQDEKKRAALERDATSAFAAVQQAAESIRAHANRIVSERESARERERAEQQAAEAATATAAEASTDTGPESESSVGAETSDEGPKRATGRARAKRKAPRAEKRIPDAIETQMRGDAQRVLDKLVADVKAIGSLSRRDLRIKLALESAHATNSAMRDALTRRASTKDETMRLYLLRQAADILRKLQGPLASELKDAVRDAVIYGKEDKAAKREEEALNRGSRPLRRRIIAEDKVVPRVPGGSEFKLRRGEEEIDEPPVDKTHKEYQEYRDQLAHLVRRFGTIPEGPAEPVAEGRARAKLEQEPEPEHRWAPDTAKTKPEPPPAAEHAPEEPKDAEEIISEDVEEMDEMNSDAGQNAGSGGDAHASRESGPGEESAAAGGVPPAGESPPPPGAAPQPGPERPARATVDVSAERAALLAAEQGAQAKDAEYYKQSLFKRAAARFSGKRGAEEDKTDSSVDVAALNYEKKLEEKLKTRLDEKQLDKAFADKVAERYRRSVIHKDVIARGEEARAAARGEVIASRTEGTAEKVLAWIPHRLASWNATLEQKYGKVGARLARISLSAAVGAGVGAALAPVSVAALGARAGIKLVAGLAGWKAGELAGSAVGALYEKTRGASLASKREVSKTKTARTVEDIAGKREAYRAGSPEEIARRRKRLEMFAATMAGAGFSLVTASELGAGISHVEAAQPATGATEAPATPPPTSLGTPEHPPVGLTTPPVEEHIEPPPAPVEAPKPSAPVTPEAPPTLHPEATVPTPTPFHELNVEVRPGYGAEAMIKDLWRQMHDANNHFVLPPGVGGSHLDLARLYEATPTQIDALVHVLAQEHGMFHSGMSEVIGRGASMHFDDGMLKLENPLPAHAPALAPHVAMPSDTASGAFNREELARIQAGKPPLPATPTPETPAPHMPHTPPPVTGRVFEAPIPPPEHASPPPVEVEPLPPTAPAPPFSHPADEIREASTSGLPGAGVAAGFMSAGTAKALSAVSEKAKAPPPPPIAIEANPGESYDVVIRHVWDALQGKKLNANEYPVGSDLHQLLIADTKSIDRIAHLIAVHQKHQFFGNPPQGFVLELREDGDLHVLGDGEEPVTTPVAPTPPEAPETPPAPTGEAPAQAVAAEGATEEPSRETSAATGPSYLEHDQPFKNHYGLDIDPRVAGVYLDTNGAAIAYGNDYNARLAAAEAYATENKGQEVWVPAEKPVEYPIRGEFHPWAFPVIFRKGWRGKLEVGLPPPGVIPPVEQMGPVNPEKFTKKLF